MITLGKLLEQLAELVGEYSDKDKIDVRVLGQQIEGLTKFLNVQGSKQEIKDAYIKHAFIPGGEIRFGTGTPGSVTNPFTGVRISSTGITYGDTTYYSVNVYQDEVTSGTTTATGETTAGDGAVIINADGVIIQADNSVPYLIFKDENGTEVATVFQDGANNLQFDVATEGNRFTFNDGDVIVLRDAGKDPAFSLHENGVLKANMFWDASDLNYVITNHIANGNMVLALNPSGAGGAGNWTMRDGTGSVDRFRFSNSDGGFGLRKTSSDPAYIDGYAIVYFYSDGAGTDELRVRGKIGATETQATLADLSP